MKDGQHRRPTEGQNNDSEEQNQCIPDLWVNRNQFVLAFKQYQLEMREMNLLYSGFDLCVRDRVNIWDICTEFEKRRRIRKAELF